MDRFTLNLNGPFIDLPQKLSASEPTHISRYWIAGSFVSQLAKQLNIKQPKLLDVGGLNGLLPDFGFSDCTELDVQPIQKPNYIQADALNMPFGDNSFDMVVSCDVFEHIAAKDRQQFLKELHRVAKYFVVICAPFDNPGVAEAEKWANNFYKSLSGQDHPWLIEHIENKLPVEADIEQFLRNQQISFITIRHLSLVNWRLILQLDLLRAVKGDSEVLQTHAPLIYNQYLQNECARDFTADGYRTFYVIGKAGQLDLVPMQQDQTTSSSLSDASVEGLLKMITAFCLVADKDALIDREG